ncbi:MAG: hypothetical protein ACTHMI_16115 [Mucilaginibacter sp.]
MSKRLLFLIIPLFFVLSCHKNVKNVAVVYHNDFETNDLTNITNGDTVTFNHTTVLGTYNNSGFTLLLKSLPAHDLVTVSFDLYIHDSWDGNKMAPDGPDIWTMLVDGSQYINTTFSNDDCGPGQFCSPQSYPLNYPNNYNNPKTGAYRTDLPGFCSWSFSTHGTTLYKITKTFKHSGSTLKLQCIDKLVQTNTFTPKCDESWSIDNITVKATTL